MKYNYRIKGFDNANIKQYEYKTFTYEEAVKVAQYLNEECNADFVVILDISTTKIIYSIVC